VAFLEYICALQASDDEDDDHNSDESTLQVRAVFKSLELFD